ncbi:MAG: formate dehydrogenase subunit alpha [Proteobacteria bacterium]|nr:formate dehydrogenase subunit alpha [Pseudomonadota bacterium]
MYSIDHRDLGTPAPLRRADVLVGEHAPPAAPAADAAAADAAAALVQLEIDGRSVSVPEGTSVMRAANLAGVAVPKLCATDTLKAFGSCRLCLVEIEGRKGYPASCTTTVSAGMKIRTQSDRLTQLRRSVIDLYVSDHPLDCQGCPADSHCELQDMAAAVGVTHSSYSGGAVHRPAARDTSNPYFAFDPSLCIVCSRCVRACEEVQGTFALTIQGRGFESKVAASEDQSFLESECVSCGACVEACPTAALAEKSLIAEGPAQHAVATTCAYCGVGCGFKAEVRAEGAGTEVVRMVPDRAGGANHGHACVKGRFAWGYATHADRVLKPMIRKSIREPWREVSWQEAIGYAASELKRIQAKYGRDSIGGITSSRCTNEETFLVQKLVRAAFRNNNVDTCARVCHSPTGYGLKNTLGESAGTQAFDSVMQADTILVIGANPTDGHPVFASQLKRRLREGAKLIVADPRRTGLVHSAHIDADVHLPVKPGSNVALLNALAHVVVTEGLVREDYVAQRCEADSFAQWRAFVAEARNSPEATADITGVPAEALRQAARLYGRARNAAIYYGLGITEHSQGTTAVMAIANLAMATGNLGREGVGVSPLRGQNNVQGSCDMGSFPHEFSAYRHVSDPKVRAQFESDWGVALQAEPGLRIPNMFEASLDGTFRGMYVQGEDFVQSDPNTHHVSAAMGAMECVIVQDLFLNETARYAHVFLPGSTFLEKDGTFTNAERRVSRVRKVMPPPAGYEDWQITCLLSEALGYPMHYEHPSQIMEEIARLTPTFAGITYDKIDRQGSIQWPCNEDAPTGTPTMHVGEFVRGKGRFWQTEYVPTSERSTSRFPLILTTGRVLTQYNVGAQTRRTGNVVWHAEDVLEIHPHDAEVRGIEDGDWVGLTSRAGQTVLRAKVSEKIAPGVVYTTFHFPETNANVVTTENSDWATNCPEYKVTAVEVVLVTQKDAWSQRAAAERELPRSKRNTRPDRTPA